MKFTAILIDDDTQKIDALRKKWDAVFELAEMNTTVQTVTEFELTEDQLKERPHFIIADNILEEKVDGQARPKEVAKGVDLIAEHKPAHSDTVFILSTAATFSIDVLGQKFPNPDLIVPKTALSSDAYKKNLASLVRSSVGRTPFGRLNIPDPQDDSAVNSFRESLVSIIEQCLHSVTARQAKSDIKQVNLQSLTGGFSGSYVFSVRAFDDDNRGKVPLVLKVTKGAGASREAEAYNSYVRLNMPHDMRVDMLGCGEAGNYKGALYAFAFGDSPDLCSLASHIQRGDYGALSDVVTRFFSVPDIGWYNGMVCSENAEEFYANSEEYSLEKDSNRLETLRLFSTESLGEREAEVTPEWVRFGNYRFPFIRKQLEKFGKTVVPQCICHGDFNTNNVIFARSNESIATIDFEYSGVDIVYKDFVSLECSLRIDDVSQPIGGVDEFNQRVEYELMLLMGDEVPEEACGYATGVSIIRSASRACLERAAASSAFDPRLYALALAFHLLKLLGIASLPSDAKAQLLAAFTAAGAFLDQE